MLQTSQETSVTKDPSKLSAITVDERKRVTVKRKTYSIEEVLEASRKYFDGDVLAANTWATKYALQDASGQFCEKTPADMHRRMAREFGRIEAKYPNPMSEEEIFGLLDRFKYIVPQGSPMSGIGNDFKIQSFSNCFVIESPADSYGGILMTDQEQVQIMKRRGGVGFDLSTIRPKGMLTANAAQTTDGIEIFMDRFSNSCREVAQGGRRGALMLTLDVHHPQVRDFVKIKRENLQRVTGANISLRLSDDFMEAVESGSTFQLRFPVDPNVPHLLEEYVDARKLWDEIIESAHACAEPGLLFWGNAKKYTPSDIYEEEGFGSVSTNPCLAGDTLVAVADGRNAVSLRELAEAGLDVPVYSLDPVTGEVSIQTGRNPRITGRDREILRVHLDSGGHIDVTKEHKFYLLDGTSVLAKDLKAGDSLPRFTKETAKTSKSSRQLYYRVRCDVRNSRRKKIYEHRLIAEFMDPEGWASKYDAAKSVGWLQGGLVVHHRDYDGLNNSPENLQVMTWKEHQQFHAEHDTAGDKNGRFLGVSSDEIKTRALELTATLGRKFTAQEWQEFAKKQGLPKTLSKMHHSTLGNDVNALANLCASQFGCFAGDPRLFRTFEKALEQGYEAEIVGSQVQVRKTCESCATPFLISYFRREGAYCSHPCALDVINARSEMHKARVGKTQETYKVRGERLKTAQAKAWSELRFDLRRSPKQSEWEECCRNKDLPFRLRTKNGFQGFNDVAEAGSLYNHKVLKVEILPGTQDVYNITVDQNHTFAVVTETVDLPDKKVFSGAFTAQCGEIILSPNDSCRLMVVNLASFVTEPFTPNADFEWAKYNDVVMKAQRMMDDMIDLEIEQIDKILTKIKGDPESDAIKAAELNLWGKIRKAAVTGRRTGLGVTAVGDTVAMMNLVYGSDDSIEFVEQLYKALAVGSYRSSIQMADERGCFPVYNFRKEEDHPFIERILQAGGDEMRAAYEAHGRRNIANTTTAPCGSVSILTQTTSGIEPAYTVMYTRRKKINPNDEGAKVDFVDEMGDKWTEFTVRHHGFSQWQKINGKTDGDLEESPYFGGTSNDVDWVQKVKMQGAAQNWICHAISNTTNLPADADVETVKNVYMTGWKSGCKGVTVYVDGSRAGVLVQKKSTFVQHSAPKRPERLPCEVHRSRIKMDTNGEGTQDWIFFVGLLEGKPFEIFGGTTENLELPKKIESGWVVKRPFKAGGKYDFYYGDLDDPTKVKNIVNQFDNPDRGWATRMISLSLRHGSPIQYVVEQLQRDKEAHLYDFGKVLARVLKKYIPDGTTPQAEKVCLDCGAEGSLRYQEGCVLCSSCGASKCG